MNRHYDRYLVKKYHPLYRNRFAPITETAMCWGFDVGDGWFHLINMLSYELCRAWLGEQRRYELIRGRIGELRFASFDERESEFNFTITQKHIDEAYEIMKDEERKVPVAAQIKEKFGTLRFYVDNANEYQRSVIHFVEMMSGSVCEVCGKPGKQTNTDWTRTLCKEHRNEHIHND